MTAPSTDPSSWLPLSTDRLRLRRAVPGDLDALASLWADPEVCRYLPFAAMDLSAAMVRFATRFLAEPAVRESGDAVYVVVELSQPSPVVVGEAMMRMGAGDPPGVAELGWAFLPTHHGRGLATEAAAALRDVAFTRLGCHRVEATLDPRNEASAAVCRRLGMRQESHLRRNYWSHDEWSDTATWGLLREDVAVRPG